MRGGKGKDLGLVEAYERLKHLVKKRYGIFIPNLVGEIIYQVDRNKVVVVYEGKEIEIE